MADGFGKYEVYALACSLYCYPVTRIFAKSHKSLMIRWFMVFFVDTSLYSPIFKVSGASRTKQLECHIK